ncbi:peptidoglycan-binding protein [Sinomonas sp. JGH33]|uniref:Peptidoglycan-binding protein n=1 Tax=Sinomonas terricola TaxID=3110330 RepID=A0ABU5TBD3_9MICC|nr:peptidoglycan-binding protein [Sinomonas sp. JGH33]MEA5457007.1 peptidoglycan-binding protein [Sinomonas sp. JGH33]
MATVSAFIRPLVATAAVVGAFVIVGGSSAAVPPPPPAAPAASASAASAPDPLGEQRAVVLAAREATQARLVQEAAEAEQKAEAAAQAAAAEAAAQAAAAQAAQAAAAQAAQAAAAQAAQDAAAQAARQAPAPAPAPKPAAPPSAFIPVVGAGGQAAVNACQGPVHFTPVTVSVSIAEHDYCGGWNRMSWIQPGTIVTVQGYGTFTAFQRMVVSQGASEYVVGNFAGGYPPIFLQTCIPGTDQMLLIGLH